MRAQIAAFLAAAALALIACPKPAPPPTPVNAAPLPPTAVYRDVAGGSAYGGARYGGDSYGYGGDTYGYGGTAYGGAGYGYAAPAPRPRTGPPASEAECRAAIDHLFELMLAQVPADQHAEIRRNRDQAMPDMLKACLNEATSAQAKCLATAKTMDDVQACE